MGAASILHGHILVSYLMRGHWQELAAMREAQENPNPPFKCNDEAW